MRDNTYPVPPPSFTSPRFSEPLSVFDLARRANVSPQRIVMLLKQGEREGWAQRVTRYVHTPVSHTPAHKWRIVQ